jgi:hypothetical protein
VRPLLNRPITSVGSSETGGIAHRQADDALWTPLCQCQIQCAGTEELAVKPTMPLARIDLTGDKVRSWMQIIPKVRSVIGALDRIVKLEEKRLSLDAIEAKIAELVENNSAMF